MRNVGICMFIAAVLAAAPFAGAQLTIVNSWDISADWNWTIESDQSEGIINNPQGPWTLLDASPLAGQSELLEHDPDCENSFCGNLCGPTFVWHEAAENGNDGQFPGVLDIETRQCLISDAQEPNGIMMTFGGALYRFTVPLEAGGDPNSPNPPERFFRVFGEVFDCTIYVSGNPTAMPFEVRVNGEVVIADSAPGGRTAATGGSDDNKQRYDAVVSAQTGDLIEFVPLTGSWLCGSFKIDEVEGDLANLTMATNPSGQSAVSPDSGAVLQNKDIEISCFRSVDCGADASRVEGDEQVFVPVETVPITASSCTQGSTGFGRVCERLIDGSGLEDCGHNNNAGHMWLNDANPSPNAPDGTVMPGTSSWVELNLDAVMTIASLDIYNYNEAQYNDAAAAVDVDIAVSDNGGSSYTQLGTFALTKPNPFGELCLQPDNVDLGGVQADRVLIKIFNNYGTTLYGLSEVVINPPAATIWDCTGNATVADATAADTTVSLTGDATCTCNLQDDRQFLDECHPALNEDIGGAGGCGDGARDGVVDLFDFRCTGSEWLSDQNPT